MGNTLYKIYQDEKTLENSKEVMKSGAIYLYTILVDSIIREDWIDKPGYPLKEEYYNNGMLVCSFSSITLQQITGVGRKIFDKWVKVLKEAGWIKTEHGVRIRDGQNVYILGGWEGDENIYCEFLFKDEEE